MNACELYDAGGVVGTEPRGTKDVPDTLNAVYEQMSQGRTYAEALAG